MSSGAEPGTHVLTILRELSKEEYEQYKKARALVIGFVDDYQQFTMVRSSYAAYRRLLEQYGQQYASGPPWNEVIAGAMRHEVNRRLRGFFTEFRTFLDYAETSLKNEHGKNSDKVRRFKEACSKEYDGNFAYRFIYYLRNYGQHVNLPLGDVRLRSGELDTEAEHTHYLTFEVNRDALLNSSFSWKASVRAELEKLPTRFQLDPYIEKTMEALERIHVTLVAVKTPDTKLAAKYISDMAGSIKEQGAPCVVFGAPDAGSEVPEVINPVQEWIPVEIAEAIGEFPDPSTLLQWPRLEIELVSYPRERARSGEGITNLINGYMHGGSPSAPLDPGITGTIHHSGTGEEAIENVVPNRHYRVGPLRMTEPDVARLTYLANALVLSSKQERLGLLERLLSRATDDALWEYARQAGKSHQEVYAALMKLHPDRGGAEHSTSQ